MLLPLLIVLGCEGVFFIVYLLSESMYDGLLLSVDEV